MIKKTIYMAAFLQLSLLSVTPASSEPSPVTRFLLTEPVSMMTYAMEKIALIIEKIGLPPSVKGSSFLVHKVKYQWDEDLIQLGIYGFYFPKNEINEENCAWLIEQVRRKACITSGIYIKGQSETCLGAAFEHDFRSVNAPQNVGKQMDDKMKIFISLHADNGADVQTGLLRCEASLIGTNYSVRRP